MPKATTALLNGAIPTTTPAPVALPLKSVLPPLPFTAVLLAAGAASFVVSALRPKAVPAPAQLAADVLTVTVVTVHPLETVVLGRVLRNKNITSGTRRKTLGGSLVFGLFSSFPALRAIRKATKATR